MSEQAPKAPMGPAEANRHNLENKANSNESEWKMLGFAKQAAKAKKENNIDSYNAAVAFIQSHLSEAVREGKLTEEGARNRAEQIDKIIDNLAGPDERLHGGPVKVAERVSVRTGSETIRPVAPVAETPVVPTTPEAPAAPNTPETNPSENEPTATPEQNGSGTEEDPYVNDAPEDLPTTAELEEDKPKLNWRQRARRSLKLKAVYVRELYKSGGNFGVAREAQYNFTDITKEEQAERRKKNGRYAVVGALAATGIVLAFKGQEIADSIMSLNNNEGGDIGSGGEGGESDLSQPDVDGANPESNSLEETYSQARELNPFYDDDKLGVHNYGGPLDASDADIKNVAGSGELTENWRHNSGQLAVAAAEMGLPDFSTADTDAARFGLEGADYMADNLESDLDKYDQTYQQLVAILEKETTIAEEIVLEPGTYGSYYQVDVNGELVNAYDPTVNEAATGIKYTYQLDDGSWHQVIFKKECGGQIVHLHETGVASTVVETPTERVVVEQPVAPMSYTTELPPVYGDGNPETPGTPDTPDTPDNPDTPDIPDEPDTPDTPDEPETPDEPDNPPTLAPKEFDENDIGIWDAPKATTDTNEFDSLGDPIQNNTDEVVNQAPGSEVTADQTGGQASGAETVTPVEQEQQATTPEATGAAPETSPGTSTGGYFGESTSVTQQSAPVAENNQAPAPAATVGEAASGPANQ